MSCLLENSRAAGKRCFTSNRNARNKYLMTFLWGNEADWWRRFNNGQRWTTQLLNVCVYVCVYVSTPCRRDFLVKFWLWERLQWSEPSFWFFFFLSFYSWTPQNLSGPPTELKLDSVTVSLWGSFTQNPAARRFPSFPLLAGVSRAAVTLAAGGSLKLHLTQKDFSLVFFFLNFYFEQQTK